MVWLPWLPKIVFFYLYHSPLYLAKCSGCFSSEIIFEKLNPAFLCKHNIEFTVTPTYSNIVSYWGLSKMHLDVKWQSEGVMQNFLNLRYGTWNDFISTLTTITIFWAITQECVVSLLFCFFGSYLLWQDILQSLPKCSASTNLLAGLCLLFPAFLTS